MAVLDFDLLARYPQYVQLIGVGLVWITLHCAGMCGPIVIGLDLGANLSEENAKAQNGRTRLGRLAHSTSHITMYQVGRSVTYAAAGALAGWGGAALQNLFREVTKATGFLVAGALLVYGLIRLFGVDFLEGRFSSGTLGTWMAKGAKWARTFSGVRQKFLLGVILGFLPCMITFWALSLAASTQSPLHGAILMVLLVWMTSFVIYTFGMAPALTPQRFHHLRERLLSIFLVFSGIWLGLVSAGANEWIPHRHVSFSMWGKGFTIMFW